MSPVASGDNRQARPRSIDEPVAPLHEQGHAGGRSRSGSGTMRVRAVLLAAALALAPPGARAADLVVWWDKAYYPEENQALAELTRAFEAKTGLKIELVRHDLWDTPKE